MVLFGALPGCSDTDTVAFPDLLVPGDVMVVEGDSSMFTLQASPVPDRDYRCAINVGPHGDKVSLTPTAFTLSPSSPSQIVTVTGLADSDSNDEGFDASAAFDGGESTRFLIVVLDVQTVRPIPSSWTIAMPPESKATFDVRLTQPPSSPVTITVVSDDVYAAVGDPYELVFDQTDYDVPRTVTVTSYYDLRAGATSLHLASDLPTATITIYPQN